MLLQMLLEKILGRHVQFPDHDALVDSDSDYEDDVVEELVERTLNPPPPDEQEQLSNC